MAVTVCTFGVPAGRWDIPEQVTVQLRLAHELREDLVTAQLEHEQAIKDVWSSYPRVAHAEWLLAEADYVAEQLAEQVRELRSRQRTKRLTGPLPDQLNQQRKEVKRLRQIRRDEIAIVKDDAKVRLEVLREEMKGQRKQLYAEYCQSGGLYWATFNAVADHHAAAVKRVAAQRKQGRPAALRHHRFDGTGTLAVQLQRQAGKPPRTPAVIADMDGKYRDMLHVPWTDPDTWEKMSRADRRHAGRFTVRIRCGSRDGEPQWINFPVQAHRMLPAGADITGAELTITRIADRFRARLAVTAKIPDPKPVVTEGATVAVHLGWRNTENGTLVAVWRSTAPLDIPAQWCSVVRVDAGGCTGIIVLPEFAAQRMDRVQQIASIRDKDLNLVRERVVEWLTEHGPVPHPVRVDEQITADVVARWRSPARFVTLARWWEKTPPPEAEALAKDLTAWRRADRKLWHKQEYPRGRALRRRDDLWRNVANILSDQCKRVVVDDMSISDIARQSSSLELPNELKAAIARRRNLASPGLLRQYITTACAREGVPVTVVSAIGLSRTHSRCGYQNPADDRYMRPKVLCDGCGHEYEPDLSATMLMLERANDSRETGAR